jgi:hypothetical protein
VLVTTEEAPEYAWEDGSNGSGFGSFAAVNGCADNGTGHALYNCIGDSITSAAIASDYITSYGTSTTGNCALTVIDSSTSHAANDTINTCAGDRILTLAMTAIITRIDCTLRIAIARLTLISAITIAIIITIMTTRSFNNLHLRQDGQRHNAGRTIISINSYDITMAGGHQGGIVAITFVVELGYLSCQTSRLSRGEIGEVVVKSLRSLIGASATVEHVGYDTSLVSY